MPLFNRQGTPWPNAGSALENLCETRKDWPIPHTPVPTPVPTIKTEEPPKITAIPHAMVMPKQATEKCSWGPHYPICMNNKEHEEDRDGKMQNQPRMLIYDTQQPQPQKCQHPQSQNLQFSPAAKQSALRVTKHPVPPAAEYATVI